MTVRFVQIVKIGTEGIEAVGSGLRIGEGATIGGLRFTVAVPFVTHQTAMNHRTTTAKTRDVITVLASSDRRVRLGIGMAVTIASVFWAWLNLEQGWFPHDEGQLGQAAERILDGQVPHRDFDEMYTGGLSFLNALSFRLWGIDSYSMRLMLLIWFAPFVAAVYWLGARLTKPWAAGLATLLAACWSIPMYSAAMPSWYNLFFAVWATCCASVYINNGKRIWLLFAGVLIGLSISFKISGLFVLAALLLLVVYRSQEPAEQTTTSPGQTRTRFHVSLSAALTLGLLLASSISLIFVNQKDGMSQTAHFVLPFLCLTGFVIYREWVSMTSDLRRRTRFLLADLSMLVCGVAVPLTILVGYFYTNDAFSDFLHGALVAPKKRVEFASSPFPFLASFVLSLPLFCLVYPRLFRTSLSRELESRSWIAIAVIAVGMLILKDAGATFSLTYLSIRNLAPILVVGNLLLLVRLHDAVAAEKRQMVFLLTAVTFFLSLIQFPFAAPIYFFYFAPAMIIGVLAAIGLQAELKVASQVAVPWRSLSIVALFLLVYSGARFHNPQAANCMTSEHVAQPGLALNTVRSRVVVDRETAAVFNRLQEIVASHTSPDDIVLATPDSPEIPFLTDRRPFNGVMYEFFKGGLYTDLALLRNRLAEQDVPLVVIKEDPPFSPPVTDEFRELGLKDYDLLEQITNADGAVHFSVYGRASLVKGSEPPVGRDAPR